MTEWPSVSTAWWPGCWTVANMANSPQPFRPLPLEMKNTVMGMNRRSRLLVRSYGLC